MRKNKLQKGVTVLGQTVCEVLGSQARGGGQACFKNHVWGATGSAKEDLVYSSRLKSKHLCLFDSDWNIASTENDEMVVTGVISFSCNCVYNTKKIPFNVFSYDHSCPLWSRVCINILTALKFLTVWCKSCWEREGRSDGMPWIGKHVPWAARLATFPWFLQKENRLACLQFQVTVKPFSLRQLRR